MPRLELDILGPFQVTLDGQPVTTFESNKVRALLAYLAVEASRPQPRERLAGLLWPDWPQRSAMSNLRYALADLRKNLGDRKAEASGLLAHPPYLLVSRDSLQLNPAANVHVDVEEFETAIRDQRLEIGDQQSTILNLQSAIVLYRGPFLEGFSLSDNAPFEEWLLAKREYFSQQMLKALHNLADHFEQSGEFEQAKGYAQRQLDLEPWREEAHQQLMRLLALSGQRSAALAQYGKCRRALRDGLGVEPGAETIALYNSIRAGTLATALPGQPPLSPAPYPLSGQPPPSLIPISPDPFSLPHHNLPRQLTRLIGREKEIAQATELVRQNPLVTLTGSGGVGKTRLALAAAEGLLEDFKDGVWLVDLAPVTDANLVPQVLAGTLGVREEPGRPALETLTLYFHGRETLLVLDNCEHLVEACAGLAQSLLSAAPRLKMLATSREALGVPGEAAYRVPSLAFPPPGQALDVEAMQQYEAVRLFFDRARDAVVDFQRTSGNISPVVQICQRLDGIPLALELAAARVSSLDVVQIAIRLDQAFRLLAGGSRATLERHRTLRAAIDWSYHLLSEAERLLLPRLSVFAGGWTLEAAEEVCAGEGITEADVLDLLSQLVNKSILVVDRSVETGQRYRMLEMIRQYAAEKLYETGDSERLRQRHLAYYLAFAERLEDGLRGPQLVSRLNRLEAELDNFRLALALGLQTDALSELRLASSLMWFWHIHSIHRNEGVTWLEQGLQTDLAVRGRQETGIDVHVQANRNKVWAKALSAAGLNLGMQRKIEKAVSFIEESLALYRGLGEDHRLGIAFAIYCLGLCNFFKQDFIQVYTLIEQSRVLFEEIGDINRIGDCFQLLGMIETDPERKRQYYLAEMAVQKECGDIDGIATAAQTLGWAASGSGDYRKAIEWHQESLAGYRQVGNHLGVSSQLESLAYNFWYLGDYQQAALYYRQAAVIFRDTGDNDAYAVWIITQGHIALSAGLYQEARQHVETALAFGREQSDQGIIAEAQLTQAIIDWLSGDQLQANRRMEEVWTILREIKDTGPDLPTSEHFAGRLALRSGDLIGAGLHFKESLRAFLRIGLRHWDKTALLLDDLASLAVRSGDMERAARLFGAVERVFPGLPNTLSPIERGGREQDIQSARVALGDELFQAQYDLGRSLPLDQVVAYALEEA